MNTTKIKEIVGYRVELQPAACCLDDYGRELSRQDDIWIVEKVADTVDISNIRTGHVARLGMDHIHHFTSNANESSGGTRRAFLTLNVQIFLQKDRCRFIPSLRPGESVKPEPVKILEKWVDFNYPFRSGILQKVQSEGYTISWCLDTKLAQKTDLEGWEIVLERDEHGMLTKFKVKDGPANQTLIKKRG